MLKEIESEKVERTIYKIEDYVMYLRKAKSVKVKEIIDFLLELRDLLVEIYHFLC